MIGDLEAELTGSEKETSNTDDVALDEVENVDESTAA